MKREKIIMFNSYDRNDLILFQEQLYIMAKVFFKLKQTVSEARVNSQVLVLMKTSAIIIIIITIVIIR